MRGSQIVDIRWIYELLYAEPWRYVGIRTGVIGECTRTGTKEDYQANVAGERTGN